MVRTAFKTVFAHKLRLLLTALSVMMGVAFIAGTFIFTDTIDNMFNELFDDIYEGQDILVQQQSEVDVGYGDPAPIDESIVDIVRSVPGVAVAEGAVGGTAIVVAILVDRAPQIRSAARGRDEGFVDEPDVTECAFALLQSSLVARPKCQTPAANGLVGHCNAWLNKQVLNVPET